MKYTDKNKDEIIKELQFLRHKVKELEHLQFEVENSRRELEEARKSGEDALKNLRDVNFQLETAIERANKMTLMAEAGSIAKSQFLANINHEFRTPMNAIMGLTELLLYTELTEEQKDLVETILSSATSLFTLLNDILTLSKIQDEEFKVEKNIFSPEDLLKNTVKPFIKKAEKKGLSMFCHIEKNLPEKLVGDAGLFKKVIINLLDNSIKFTNKGEVIFCTELAPSKDTSKVILCCSISDTGIGIAEDKKNIIFDSFIQADGSSTRKFEGAGLGLTVCREFVNLLEGDIRIESELNKGSTFHFTAQFDRL